MVQPALLGQDANDKLEDQRFGLIVSEQSMPNLQGPGFTGKPFKTIPRATAARRLYR